MTNKTAILIFANSAEFEATQKPFTNSVSLFETLNDQTLKLVEKTGLPFYHFSEKNQIGSCFGARFTNAIQSIYEKGYENVITIGNDTPHLQVQHILKAETALKNNDIVLGPSKDGGFYLMGLKKTCFNHNTFLKLPWQTARLNRSVSKLCQSNAIVLEFLEILQDVDTISDAKRIISSFRSLSENLIQLLHLQISVEKNPKTVLFQAIESATSLLYFNKGSPLVLQNLL